MTNIRISPEARKAIAEQFELLELSEPGIYLFREPPSADLSRAADGEAMWKIERPQRCYLHFDEFTPSGDKRHELVVDSIQFWISQFRDSEEIEIEITTDSNDLFIDLLCRSVTAPQSISDEPSQQRTKTRSEFRLGLIPHREIIDEKGDNMLRLLYVTEGFGQDFHSLQWDCIDKDGLHPKHRITRKQFQGQHVYRRWVADLHSFAPDTSIAIVRVAEGDRPFASATSCNYLYSWRAWDLAKNSEVKKLKDCKDPFDPFD